MFCRYLLDTNICIYIRRQKPQSILDRFAQLKPGEAAISIVTYGELHYGAQKSQHSIRAMRELQDLMTALPVLPMPIEAGRSYGEIRAVLEKRGESIGGNDLWIAAHAKSMGMIIVTNDEREFRRVPDLIIENWAI
jgi:tRNA(fMet)-specific endonuclease VapC